MERQQLSAPRFGSSVSINIEQQQGQVILLYFLFAILLFADRWWNGMLLSQLYPSFFIEPLNVSTWAVMFTDVHKLFIRYHSLCVMADLMLIGLPCLYVFLHFKQHRRAKIFVAWVMLLFNFVYATCYTIYPSNSIEGHLGWMLFPVVLVCSRSFDFSLALQFIRYFFLFFFASAGIWKLRGGGVYNPDEMSGILLYQHTPLLVISPQSFLSEMYYWLIQHPLIGYLLYLAATVMELFFIIGFFTRRYDKILILLFVLFLLFDVLLMQIKYWDVAFLTIPLFFSGRGGLFDIKKPE